MAPSDLEKLRNDSRMDVSAPSRRLGNPGPLGLTSFASTTLLLSFINMQTHEVGAPNVVVGMALFTGGLAQLLAGMWEFATGNTFGATAFTGYGSFWMSWATILLPQSNIIASYGTGDAGALGNALGLYLVVWMIFTILLLIGTLRKSVSLISLFALLATTFAILAAANFNGSAGLAKAGGFVGILTAFNAYYVALGEILTPGDSLFTLPLGKIGSRDD